MGGRGCEFDGLPLQLFRFLPLKCFHRFFIAVKASNVVVDRDMEGFEDFLTAVLARDPFPLYCILEFCFPVESTEKVGSGGGELCVLHEKTIADRLAVCKMVPYHIFG